MTKRGRALKFKLNVSFITNSHHKFLSTLSFPHSTYSFQRKTINEGENCPKSSTRHDCHIQVLHVPTHWGAFRFTRSSCSAKQLFVFHIPSLLVISHSSDIRKIAFSSTFGCCSKSTSYMCCCVLQAYSSIQVVSDQLVQPSTTLWEKVVIVLENSRGNSTLQVGVHGDLSCPSRFSPLRELRPRCKEK